MAAVRRKATALAPRFHVMLVGAVLASQGGVGSDGQLAPASHFRHAGAGAPGAGLCTRLRSASWRLAPLASRRPARWHVLPPCALPCPGPQPPLPLLNPTVPQTTYDVAIRDTAVLRRFDWSALVIDEGHSLKGEHGSRTEGMHGVWRALVVDQGRSLKGEHGIMADRERSLESGQGCGTRTC